MFDSPRHTEPLSIPAERIPALRAALESEWNQIEIDRQNLRLQMAEVEAELVELIQQQAWLQKVQVAIDQVLAHWENVAPRPSSPD